MSAKLLFAVVKADAATLALSAPEKSVLICFVEALNPEKNGTLAWPSQERIAAQTGHGIRTVRRAMRQLQALGYLKQQQRTVRFTVYSVEVGLLWSLVKATGQSGRSGESDRPERPVQPATVAAVTGQSGRSIKQPIEPPYEQPISTVSCSSNPKEQDDDPQQRRMALASIVGGAVKCVRKDDPEQRTKNKTGWTDHGRSAAGGES